MPDDRNINLVDYASVFDGGNKNSRVPDQRREDDKSAIVNLIKVLFRIPTQFPLLLEAD